MRDGEAQVFLLAMQSRLQTDPRLALGLTPTSNAAEARTAFLTLTKQYHPVKFARCDSTVQRLANEVFLQLREAHDGVVKNARSAVGTVRTAAVGAATTTGPMRTIAAATKTTSPLPAIGRTPTPNTVRPAPGITMPRTISPPNSQKNVVEPVITRPPPTVVAVAKPVVNPPGTARPVAAKTPATTAAPTPRMPTPLATTSTKPATQPAPTPAGVTFRSAAAPASTPSTVDESGLFTRGKELLRHKSWHEARDVFVVLTRVNSHETAYKAMLALARGRIDQADGNLEGARTQYSLALQHEPAFTAAATALDEIAPAESKSSLWSKLRGK